MADIFARIDLPLTDWRSTKPHTAEECEFELCKGCGCCAHGKTRAMGCPMDLAPHGAQCGGSYDGCCCEGRA